MNRRSLLLSALSFLVAPRAFAAGGSAPRAVVAAPAFGAIADEAAALHPLETLLVARAGEIVAARGYRGHSVDAPTNIKSVSKAILSALVGIAIDPGLLQGTVQPIAPLLRDQLPENPAGDTQAFALVVGSSRKSSPSPRCA